MGRAQQGADIALAKLQMLQSTLVSFPGEADPWGGCFQEPTDYQLPGAQEAEHQHTLQGWLVRRLVQGTALTCQCADKVPAKQMV